MRKHIYLTSLFLLVAIWAGAQEQTMAKRDVEGITGSSAAKPYLPQPAARAMTLENSLTQLSGVKINGATSTASGLGGLAYIGRSPSTPSAGNTLPGTLRITLEEAQQMAAGASNPLVRLGELQMEIAKQHRLGVQAMYFPNIGGQFFNLHFNKNTGPVLTLGPLSETKAINVVGKDQTAFNFSAVQPVTPLFTIYQLAKIARADENIARAKAGMPVAETASNVEKTYFELLIAERELISATAEARKIQSKRLIASNSASTISPAQESDLIAAEKAIALPTSKVKELTASLNEMIGLPEGTRLELVPPEPLVESVSMQEVADDPAAGNAEVVEAEQTAIKAHSGSKLSKLAYIPEVVILGGYANQDHTLNVLLPRDFTYIGVMATYTVFDFGKREHGVKEASAQAQAADLAVQLTKAKVKSAVKSSYLELERSRKAAQLAHRMVSAAQLVEASYKAHNPDVESAQARMEAEMFRAELEHRQAYAKLRSLMGSN